MRGAQIGKNMFSALLEYQFLQFAFLAILLSSVVCGIMSNLIIEKKMLMISGGLAHTAYGGIGLAYLLGFSPTLGALGFTLASALFIAFLHKKSHVSNDIFIALFWALGMALGIIFIGLIPGYTPNIESYLFGNILSVSKEDVLAMFCLSVLICFSVFAFYRDWQVFLFDEEFARLQGIAVGFYHYFLYVLVTLSIILLIRVAGIILVLALLSAPAASAALCSHTFKGRLFVSVAFSFAFSFMGLWLSYTFDISSGACIVVFAFCIYTVLLLINRRRI